MLSATFAAEHYPSPHLHIAQSSPSGITFTFESLVSEVHPQIFENLSIQGLHGLMSPSPSNKDYCESFDGREDDEDDEMEGLETSSHRSSSSRQFQLGTESVNAMIPLQVLRPSRPMVLESAFNITALASQHFPSPPYPAYNTLPPAMGIDHMYSQLQSQQQPQSCSEFPPRSANIPNQGFQCSRPLSADPQLHQLQQQEPQPFYSPYVQHVAASTYPASTVYPTPSITPYGSFEPTFPMQQQRDPSSLHYYLGSMEHSSQPLQQQQHQQHRLPSDTSFQRPTLQNTVPPFEQNVELLMVPHIASNSSNMESVPLLMSSSASSWVQSPTMSWVSISREVSPDRTPVVAVNKRPGFRSSKKRQGSTHSRSGGKISRTKSYTSSAGSSGMSNDVSSQSCSHGQEQQQGESSTSLASGAPAKRKRRVRQVKIKVKPTSFHCEIPNCGKVFSRAYNLTSHMKTHSEERPFLCGSCPLAFARRHDRERHLRLHTGEKPYTCENCGCGFMRNDALHRHQKTCGQSATALMALLQQQQQHQKSQQSYQHSQDHHLIQEPCETNGAYFL
ncbi:hypothetical protein EDD11_007630 [Mortierella claussenii]|nr:hypothetical protein EDD11_007630 [Mortierella claussenii]